MPRIVCGSTQKAVGRKELRLSFEEPSNDVTSVKLRLHLTKTNDKMQPAKDPNPRYSRKPRLTKNNAVNTPFKTERHVSTAHVADIGRIPSEAQEVEGCESGRSTMMEYLENVVIEHERALSEFPSPSDIESINGRLSDLEARILVQLWENDRLRDENKDLVKTVAGLKDSNMKMELELDEVRRYLGGIPPRYRRRDDLRGRPFTVWRRDPSTAAHRPQEIDTRVAERYALKQRKDEPKVEIMQYRSTNEPRGAEGTTVNRSNSRERQKEEIELVANGVSLAVAQSRKRSRDDYVIEENFRLRPIKRVRDSNESHQEHHSACDAESHSVDVQHIDEGVTPRLRRRRVH